MENDWGVPDWFYDEHESRQFDQTDKMTEDGLIDFAQTVASATTELPCQLAIERYPWVLLQFMRTGHGNWVFPRPSLNGKFYPDFLCAEGSSAGLHWFCIELEGPQRQPFVNSGTFSHYLHHALDQIKDWRAYIEANKTSICSRPHDVSGGCGLHDIRAGIRGYVFIGRRAEYPQRYQVRRSQLDEAERIQVKSFDTLVEGALDLFYRPPYSWQNESGDALKEKIARIMKWPI